MGSCTGRSGRSLRVGVSQDRHGEVKDPTHSIARPAVSRMRGRRLIGVVRSLILGVSSNRGFGMSSICSVPTGMSWVKVLGLCFIRQTKTMQIVGGGSSKCRCQLICRYLSVVLCISRIQRMRYVGLLTLMGSREGFCSRQSGKRRGESVLSWVCSRKVTGKAVTDDCPARYWKSISMIVE